MLDASRTSKTDIGGGFLYGFLGSGGCCCCVCCVVAVVGCVLPLVVFGAFFVAVDLEVEILLAEPGSLSFFLRLLFVTSWNSLSSLSLTSVITAVSTGDNCVFPVTSGVLVLSSARLSRCLGGLF